ncbi:MAG: hypothetical protein JWO82_2396 [Akkermansiaceae bacterium]|nr:hypothetical protein [Akkermansiaceae bacterium]
MRLFRERLAQALEKRLAIHANAYRDVTGERGRTWITLDGEEIASFCYFAHETVSRTTDNPGGDFTKWDFGAAFGRYLDLSIEDALASENPIITGLALLDRRVGKRRLKLLAEREFAEPAKTLLDVRLAAEGLPPARGVHSPV